MAFNDRSRIYILGYASVFLAVILAVIGLGTPGWLTYWPNILNIQMWFGLWQWCRQGSGEFHCEFYDYNTLDEYTQDTQVMACIGVAFLVLSKMCRDRMSISVRSVKSSTTHVSDSKCNRHFRCLELSKNCLFGSQLERLLTYIYLTA